MPILGDQGWRESDARNADQRCNGCGEPMPTSTARDGLAVAHRAPVTFRSELIQ
jgi:hypothetical protein